MKNFLNKAMRAVGRKVVKIFDQLTDELAKDRTVLVWLYSAALLALIYYCAKTNPSSQSTSIYTLGGIVGTCFSSWVVAGSYESVAKMRLPSQPPVQEPPVATEPAEDPSDEQTAGD